KDAAAGEVFAAGHAEHGNDIPGLLSSAKAERVDGGYKLTGRKAFGSLTPVWTRLGGHAMDTSDPKAPKIVHFFLTRDAKGYTIKETWDVMGMRATRSDDTVLEGAFVPDKYIARVLPAGAGRTGCCGSLRQSIEPWKRRFASSIGRSIFRAASACSRRANLSGCSATAAPADSTRRTRRSRTRSSARSHLGLARTSCRAGVDFNSSAFI